MEYGRFDYGSHHENVYSVARNNQSGRGRNNKKNIMDNEPVTLVTIWKDIGAHVQLLAVSGIAGALIKALLAPSGAWRRRAVQAIAGVFSAIFLGAFIAGIVDGWTSNPALAYLASGFICGVGGEEAMRLVQHKVFGIGKDDDHDAD